MRVNILLAVAAFAAAAPVMAQVQSVTTSQRNGVVRTTEILKSGKHLEKVTCRDFNDLDESFKPQAVTYASNYGPMGKAHPTMTVAGVETIVPVVIQTCTEKPDDRLVPAVNSAMAHKS
jgi:hypothetical protein